MRYVKDMTGRFAMRPHYEPAELDKECEKILSVFFGGRIPTPIETDSLAKLIDRDTSDFDPGANLSHYGVTRRFVQNCTLTPGPTLRPSTMEH